MGLTRSAQNEFVGKCSVSYDGSTFFPRAEATVSLVSEWYTPKSIQYGSGKKQLLNRYARVTFAPLEYAALATLFPAGYRAPVTGASIFGATDKPLVLQGYNGTTVTVVNAGLSKLSTVTLGTGKDIIGGLEFTGVIADGADLTDEDSILTISTGTFSNAAADEAKDIHTKYGAAWGAVTGFSAFEDYDGWTVNMNLGLDEPIKQGGYLWRDIKVADLTASATARVSGPTLQQIKDAIEFEGMDVGELMTAHAADLTITGVGVGTPLVVLKNAGATGNFDFTFGTSWGVGAITWEAEPTTTLGVIQPKITLGTVSA